MPDTLASLAKTVPWLAQSAGDRLAVSQSDAPVFIVEATKAKRVLVRMRQCSPALAILPHCTRFSNS